jgi:hypothetical protein
MRRAVATFILVLVTCTATVLLAEEGEGTRHITGPGLDMYFMNDKVFGTAGGHPLWAMYTCGKEIKGEMDVAGAYRAFDFTYLQEGDRTITGTFASTAMALGAIDKQDNGFVYHVFIGEREQLFSIRYQELEGKHMVNSVIEGTLPDGKTLKLTVDGRLCPMATTGIILIAAGSALQS